MRKLSWKIWSVVMCSNEIFDRIFWKIVCVLMIIWKRSPRKFIFFLEIGCVPYKRIMSSWKIQMFSYYIKASWKIWCVLDISLKKVASEKKDRYFNKKSSLAASENLTTKLLAYVLHHFVTLALLSRQNKTIKKCWRHRVNNLSF